MSSTCTDVNDILSNREPIPNFAFRHVEVVERCLIQFPVLLIKFISITDTSHALCIINARIYMLQKLLVNISKIEGSLVISYNTIIR